VKRNTFNAEEKYREEATNGIVNVEKDARDNEAGKDDCNSSDPDHLLHPYGGFLHITSGW
jgi:hypothetical protein